MRKRIYLHHHWQVKNGSSTETKTSQNEVFEKLKKGISAEIPGTIHTDLLKAGLIPDPFYADNEKKTEWIHLADWIYTTTFNLPEKYNSDQTIYLVFEGLDTVARIELNGQLLAETDNMFRTYRFLVTDKLKSKDNQLNIYFSSPIGSGRELNERFGKLDAVRFEERVYLRKAQYSFGWDWGPSLPTVGIWRPVCLEYTNRTWIESISFDTLEMTKKEARVRVKTRISGDVKNNKKIRINLSHRDRFFEAEKQISAEGFAEIIMVITDPLLWWPSGLGEQPLYNLQVTLIDNKNTIDLKECMVGIRRIKLIRQKNGKQVFEFNVNNQSVYIKGANWIPADSFIPRISDQTYKDLLTKAKKAGMNMIRVWGGGIYEQAIFYDLCDQLGLLVWQDFMFACSAYPENDFYIENIREEIWENVAKLQHHPSIALWCGNNENEWIWYREHKGTYKNMPGYKIFHDKIPEIISELDPLRPYWPTSPFGEDEDPNAETSGNRHSWDIWSYWVDYSKVINDKSLFVTEFGFQGPANIDTINTVVDKDSQHIQSEFFEFHNKQIEGNERLIRFLAGHLPLKTEWEEFIYLTQLNQGLALKSCLEHWRFRWPETAGSIIWQLNDCWPVTSWSLIDSCLKPKLAYYFVKRAFAPLAIYMREHDESIHTSIMNDRLTTFSGKVKIILLDLADQREVIIKEAAIKIKNGERSDLENIFKNDLPASRDYVLVASLTDHKGNLVCRNFFAAKRWKHLKLPQSKIKIDIKENNRVDLRSNSPAFFVDLFHEQVQFSDRGMIILQDETVTLNIEVDKEQPINVLDVKVYSLNNYV